jgi:hypothetical protein
MEGADEVSPYASAIDQGSLGNLINTDQLSG